MKGNLKVTAGGELGVKIKNRHIGPKLILGNKDIVNIERTLWTGRLSFNKVGSAFDMLEDEVIDEQYYDEDDDQVVTFRVKDSSDLLVSIPEEDRID